jgi:hypothetical protein
MPELLVVVLLTPDGREQAAFGVIADITVVTVVGAMVGDGKKTDARSSNKLEGKMERSGAELDICRSRLTRSV